MSCFKCPSAWTHQAAQKAKEEQEKAANAATSMITTKYAEDIVRKLVLNDLNINTISEFDHEDTVNGVKYLVIPIYDILVDHTATWGWYYVNQNNGKVFDGSLGNHVPMN